MTCGIEDGCYAGALGCRDLANVSALQCDLLVDLGTGGYTSTTESNII